MSDIRIKDGAGGGSLARVSPDQKLATTTVSVSPQFHQSQAHGLAWQVLSGVQTISPAGAYGILAMRNDGPDIVTITYIRIAVNDTETGEVQSEVSLGGTWVAGTAVTPVNLNTQASTSAEVTAHHNAIPTGASLIDARWITGGNEVTYVKEGSIILHPQGIISIKVTTETDNVKVNARISFFKITAADLLQF